MSRVFAFIFAMSILGLAMSPAKADVKTIETAAAAEKEITWYVSYSLAPVQSLSFTTKDGTPALLRLFQAPSAKTQATRS